jgi:hypothetical protein
MYAPLRSVTQANPDAHWHLLRMFANGTTMSLTAAVTGTVDTAQASDVLFVWRGGLYPDAGGGPLPGTFDTDDGSPTTDDWTQLSTLTISLSQTFAGISSFLYRLDLIDSLGNPLKAGTYNGNVTYTLVSN